MLQNDEFLSSVAGKVESGTRLTLTDGLALYRTNDLWWLGDLAEKATLQRQGRNVYYSINRHINYTNICPVQCRFCQFSRQPGQKNAYAMTVDEVLEAVAEARQQDAVEVHIVGGLNAELPFEYCLEMIGRIHQRWPDLHIKAFTATEITSLAEKSSKGIEQVLSLLIEAGLGSLPGGGAEILDELYFQQVCPNKPGPQQWLAVHAAAHHLGLMTNCTMLYGYVETLEQRLGHLLRLRDLQDESRAAGRGCFQCFVPLPYIPAAEPGQENIPNALDDLRTIAVSRLMLDNIDHVKAFWPMLGIGLAQVGLCFGADDLDGTVQQYRIVSVDPDDDAVALPVDRLTALIAETGREPLQRQAGRYP